LKNFVHTLMGRIIFGGLAMHSLLVPLLFAGVVIIIKEGFQSNFVDEVRANSYLFASLIAHEQDPHVRSEMLEDALLGGQFVYAELIDEHDPLPAPKQLLIESNAFQEDFFFGQHGDNIYFVSMPLPLPDAADAPLLHLGYDEEPVLALINRTYRVFLYLTLGYALMIVVFSGIFGPVLSAPLRRLQNDVRKIASGRYDRRLTVNSKIVEIVNLSRDLESMRQQLVKHNRELEYQSLHDSLTNLPNRVLLQDRLEQGLIHAQRHQLQLALLIIDLNGFKTVNDTLGHHSGDMLLQQIAMRMQAKLRESDTVARLGGDEFAILLPAVAGVESVARSTRKLMEAIDQPIVLDDKAFRIGMSIGIAMYPLHGTDAATLMRHADIAMYVAKRNHLDYTFYDESADENSLSRLSLMWELRHAIEHGELMLHYQPVVDLGLGHITGAEAVVRWRHPRHGIMSPEDFIPLAEHAGLIGPLFNWVIAEAFRQGAAWRHKGLNLNVAINLSTRNLHDKELAHTVQKMILTTETPPENVTLEITENAFIADPINAMENLHRLNKMGVTIAIDDFGTGYSSLVYLKKLPVHEIKIDQSFVADMLRNKDDLSIVRATIDLAHNIGCRVIAEGVESEATLAMLTSLECDKAQGYYISEPLDAEALEDWLRNSSWGAPESQLA